MQVFLHSGWHNIQIWRKFIHHTPCVFWGQEGLAERILSTSGPSIQKQIEEPVRADTIQWRKVARADVLPGIRAKFTRNTELASLIINPGTRVFGQATTDQYRGVAMSL